ncbi:HAMP domain-containing protein [Anaerolineae bacterium CFX8]|nr:HAMP domain-containing protein [Anaerolineae bacterium CFX8]
MSVSQTPSMPRRTMLGPLANLPIYAKLILAFLFVAAFATLTVIYFTNQAAADNLLLTVGTTLRARAVAHAQTIDNLLRDRVVGNLQTLALADQIENAVAKQNSEYTGGIPQIRAEIGQIDRQWVAAADSHPMIESRLFNAVADNLRQYRSKFVDHTEIFVTDRYGALVSATNRTSDYDQSDEEWWQKTWNNGQGAVYIGQPEYDDSARAYSIVVSVPIYARSSGDLIGVLRTTYLLTSILDVISSFEAAETGRADLYLPGDKVLPHDDLNDVQFSPDDTADLKTLENLPYGQITLEGDSVLATQVPLASVTQLDYVANLGWTLVIHQDVTEAFAPLAGAAQASVLAGGVVMIVAMALVFVVAQIIAAPIRRLSATARQIAAGDLSARADIASRDEIGQMAQTMNEMADQLQDLINTLEARIASRTRDLETAAQVNAQISTILDTDRLLQDVVDLTKERFGLYHAHVYLLSEDGRALILTAGAGHVGRQMVSEGQRIEMQNPQSIVAQAARTRQIVTVNDVSASPSFLPNPLLPDTQAEQAIPLIARGQLLGVLDIQSARVNHFTQDAQSTIEVLAGQIATAISNARLYEAAERTSRHEKALGSIDRKIQEAVNMDEILQATVRELGKALRVPYTAIELQLQGEDETSQ